MRITRKIQHISKSKPTIEGAGVHLKRAIGFNVDNLYDPFLLLDDFRSDEPELFLNGFPFHPHRGIETITYMLEGEVEHTDSMGNSGLIGPGDVQWMTAGNGIIHQEMPRSNQQGRMGGFQLWANLPASHKMMDPRYQDVRQNQIPVLVTSKGIQIRIICGEVEGEKGPVRDIIIDPEYLDITIPPDTEYIHPTKSGYTVLTYVIAENGHFSKDENSLANNGELVHFHDGDEIWVQSGKNGLRFLLLSGRPIGESVAWYGPIVMNTREELLLAFEEYKNGTFLKHNRS